MVFDDLIGFASALLIGLGAVFYLVGGIGLVRMPEIFTRMHAISLADTLGAGLLIAGMMLLDGLTLTSAKLLIIAVAIFFTLPVATHALAQAAIAAEVKPALEGEGPGEKERAERTR